MLQFDDSCYVDAKQYHLASFSTRNSTLNTSLRKPIRIQDFIQLCDSIQYTDATFYIDSVYSLSSDERDIKQGHFVEPLFSLQLFLRKIIIEHYRYINIEKNTLQACCCQTI